jgi:hypothetical protein
MDDDFYDEREQIAELLETVVRQYLADAGIAAVNDTYEEVFSKQAIGRFPSTREMRFYLNDLAAFTPELADRLRKQVLSKFKKWTLVPQFVYEAFTVSSKGVYFGDKLITGQFTVATKEYREWLQAARQEDEERKGPLRRQFHYLTPLIPAALAVARAQEVAVLAAFDRFVPPIWNGKPVVWVLTEGGREKPLMKPGGERRAHTVTEDGVVEPLYCFKHWPTTDIPSPFFLLAHEFYWRSRNRLKLILQREESAANVVIGPVRVTALIRDSDLKAQQGREAEKGE